MKWLILVFLVAFSARAADLSYTGPVVPDQWNPDDFLRWEQPSKLEITMHALTVSAQWLDVLQSRDQRGASAHYGLDLTEGNPAIVFLAGTNRPSAGQFFWIGGIGGTVLSTAIWYALPPIPRKIFDVILFSAETYVVSKNQRIGLRVTF